MCSVALTFKLENSTHPSRIIFACFCKFLGSSYQYAMSENKGCCLFFFVPFLVRFRMRSYFQITTSLTHVFYDITPLCGQTEDISNHALNTIDLWCFIWGPACTYISHQSHSSVLRLFTSLRSPLPSQVHWRLLVSSVFISRLLPAPN